MMEKDELASQYVDLKTESDHLFMMNEYRLSLPARTAVPTQERTPERKELNANDPTVAM